ncbi:MAG: NUDIX domain-containing protein [Klebsiella michiganensis]|nr:NUDIX domain-containing protein [Klebsiella michiganensis]
MKTLQISVGIIRNSQGEIFITQRAADAHMANKLEFPGGKIEAGESSDKLEYQFPDRHITLWFWLVESWDGEPWGKEGQPGRWIAQSALVAKDFPPANEPVIAKLIQYSQIGRG